VSRCFSARDCVLLPPSPYDRDPTPSRGRDLTLFLGAVNRCTRGTAFRTGSGSTRGRVARGVRQRKPATNTSNRHGDNPEACGALCRRAIRADLTQRKSRRLHNDPQATRAVREMSRLTKPTECIHPEQSGADRFEPQHPDRTAFPEPEAALLTHSPRQAATECLARRHSSRRP